MSSQPSHPPPHSPHLSEDRDSEDEAETGAGGRGKVSVEVGVESDRFGRKCPAHCHTSPDRSTHLPGMCRLMTVAENVVRLTIASQLEFIDLVTSLTDNLTNIAGFDEDSVYWINMAVRESVANAVEHGNRYDPNKAVDVTFVLSPESLRVSVRDHGEGFDPSDLPDPLDPINLLNPAGRGLLYMRTFMDEVEYQRHSEVGMVVNMSKKRPLKNVSAIPESPESVRNTEGVGPQHDTIGD